MPRTKQVRKRNSSLSNSEEAEILIKNYQRQAKARLHSLETDYELMCNSFEKHLKMSLSKYPPQIRSLTLGQLIKSLQEEDAAYEDISSTTEERDEPPEIVLAPPTAVKPKKLGKRQTAASMDDGYVTETGNGNANGNGNQKRTSRTDKVTSTTQKSRKSRSASRSSRIEKSISSGSLRRGTSTSRVNNQFITPSVQKPSTDYNLVTPKIKPNTPINVLRRPRDGEMVLSMQGSPILVSAIVQERSATLNVPLGNGDVMSLLPNDGLRRSHLPHLDAETLRQLQTLKGHLEKVIDRN